MIIKKILVLIIKYLIIAVTNHKTLDNKGTITFPQIDTIYNKSEFKEFMDLPISNNVKSIAKQDLPECFCERACEFIDLFRRKTINEKREWNLFIDYETGIVIHCFVGKKDNVKGIIHTALLNKLKIATIHNHPKGTYSPPSADNFEILEHSFEDYEIITGYEEYWIVEAKNVFNTENIYELKSDIKDIFIECDNLDKKKYDVNKIYGEKLQNFIKENKENIQLTKKEYK